MKFLRSSSKLVAVLAVLAVILSLASCNEQKLIFPFEADLEKYFRVLYSGEEMVSSQEPSVILDNGRFALVLCPNDSILFEDRESSTVYDSFGEEITGQETAELNVCVRYKKEPYITYRKGTWFDPTSGRRNGTLIAFRTGEDTVRFCWILGLDSFEYLDANGCSDENRNDKRAELLKNGYDPYATEIALCVTDITVTEQGFIIDISPNRQYSSEKLRSGNYSVTVLENDLPFITYTHSESTPVFSAGSK